MPKEILTKPDKLLRNQHLLNADPEPLIIGIAFLVWIREPHQFGTESCSAVKPFRKYSC
jgi:hypothetical protein